MKKYLPIIAVVIALLAGFYFVNKQNIAPKVETGKKEFTLSDFNKKRSCARLPKFLFDAGFTRPIIDLSQKRYKGIAFLQANRVLHKKEWEVYENMGTYTIDNRGNIYLAPTPFISIKPTTFNLQKNIYFMDTMSGKLSIFMNIDSIKPNANNPYGLISLLYDCQDGTLWASSIDQTNYQGSKGRLFHINLKTKEIIDEINGFDALTLSFLYTKTKRYIIAGSAMDSGVYALVDKKFIKLFELPNSQLRVRKIKVIGKNTLYLEAIKFSYSLIAQSSNKQRFHFKARYDSQNGKWEIKEIN